MKTRTKSLLISVGLLLSGFVQLHADQRADTLLSIHWVENPNNSPAPGSFGELGAYQFRAETWRMHTQRPFAEAIDRKASDEVAIRHYEWLKATLARGGVEPTAYNIALAWNAGVNAVLKGRAPAIAHDYATRVNNLASEMSANRVAMR
jgi:hypothetical protein